MDIVQYVPSCSATTVSIKWLITIIMFEKIIVIKSGTINRKALCGLVCYVLDDKELLECLRSL